MEQLTIPILATRRQYVELEKRADEHIRKNGWENLLRLLEHTRSGGKARDAVVSLLQLDSVGGADTEVFREFASLEGDNLRQVRANAIEHTMDILKEQIETKHTYFLDIEAMTMTPFVILVKDVIEARRRELERLEQSPSRIDVLGTYYGFQILMTDGSKPNENPGSTGYYRWRRRTWLDEQITETAASALKKITGELAEEVDIDKRYRTLGSSPVFRGRCTKTTTEILANGVRLAMYKTPGHRGTAARKLGRMEDSRALSFLHHRLHLEQNMKVRIAIAEALGRVSHESSIDILKERVIARERYLSKEGEAMIRSLGDIYSPRCKETLIELLESPRNATKAVAIESLGKQKHSDLVELISPYLTDKSRPVVRASVLALMELGTEGEAVIRDKTPIVLKRIGYDRPSKAALTKMLSLSGVAAMPAVHQYFAKRIEKLGNEVKSWQRRLSSQSYGYYWRRRESRARQKLTDYLRMASSYLKPPFDKELVKSIKSVLAIDNDPSSSIRSLGQGLLARTVAVEHRKDSVYEQTYLFRSS